MEKEIPIVRLSGIRKPKPSLQKHTLDRKIEGWKEEVRKKTKANWKPYKEQFKKALEKENIEYINLNTKPTFFNSVLWAGQIETKDSYIFTYYSLFDKSKRKHEFSPNHILLLFGTSGSSGKTTNVLLSKFVSI